MRNGPDPAPDGARRRGDSRPGPVSADAGCLPQPARGRTSRWSDRTCCSWTATCGRSIWRSFALVTIPFRAFQHLLTLRGRDRLLAVCPQSPDRRRSPDRRPLRPVARRSRQHANRPGDGRRTGVLDADGRKVIRRFKVVARDRAAQVNQLELIYDVTHPGGRQERLIHAFPMRYVFRYEAEHLLARCGFDLLHVYGEWDKRPFGSTYPGELICVARRQLLQAAGPCDDRGRAVRPHQSRCPRLAAAGCLLPDAFRLCASAS